MPNKFRSTDFTLEIPENWTHQRSREFEIFCKFETPIGALYVTKFTSDELENPEVLRLISILTEIPEANCRYHQERGDIPEMASVEFSRKGWHHHYWVAVNGPHAISMSYKYQSSPDRDELRDVHDIVESLRFTV